MADLKVNVITDGVDKAKGEISSLGGAGDSASGGIGKLGTAAVVGAEALIALGTKSILAFEDLGITVGKFSAATGISNKESSKLIEVAGDLGIGSDLLQKSVIKMTAGLGPAGDGLKEFGITAVKNADGTTNLSETLIAATGVINGIKDPLKRAEAQAAVFGKGYGKMAELTTMSSDQLREALAGVSDAKIFDDEKVNKAKDLRTGFDSIKDSAENVLLIIGNALAPVVTKLAVILGDVLEKVSPLAEAIGGLLASALELIGPLLEGVLKILGPIIEGLSKLIEGVTKVVDGIHDAFTEDVTATVDMTGVKEAIKVQGEAKESAEDLAAAQEEEAAAAKEAEDAHKALVKSLEENLKASQKLLNLNRAAADADFAVRDATDSYAQTLEDLTGKIEAASSSLREQKAAYREVVVSATELADRTVDLRVKQDEANGVTTTAAAKQDLWNQSMVKASAQASGPARQAIIDYIATANGIPAEKVTDIKAAVEAGDLAKAESLINGASRDRTAAVKVDVDADKVYKATATLDEIAKDRIAKFGIVLQGSGGTQKAFAGGGSTGDGPATFGEDGPEIAEPPAGTKITGAAQTRARQGKEAGTGRTVIDRSTTNHYWPVGVSADKLAKAQRQLERRGLGPTI